MSVDGRSRFMRNGIVNLTGQLLPAVAAVAAIPVLVGQLDRERFAIMTLAWALIGWFTVFDGGLGRATTRLVAVADASGEPAGWKVVRVPIAVLFGLGAVAALVGAAVVTPITGLLKMSPSLLGEARGGLLIVFASMPAVLATAGARGVLEGRERFLLSNAIRIPTVTSLFLAPVALLPLTHDLRWLLLSVTATRAAGFAATALAARRSTPTGAQTRITGEVLRDTMRYAGWTGATNIVGTAMAAGYLDRFLIGGYVSVSAVAYYSTPFEVVTKLLLVPMALMAVLFPILTRAHRSDPEAVGRLHARAVHLMVVLVGPLAVALIAASGPLLELWLGDSFARASEDVCRLLLIGTLCECVAQAPFTALQATGRADLTAKRHLVQLPVYVALAVFATVHAGVNGMAGVWLAWGFTDFLTLLWLLHRAVPGALGFVRWGAVSGILAGAVAAGLLVAYGGAGSAAQAGLAVVLALACAGAAWATLLTPDDRFALLRLVGRGRAPVGTTG